MWRAEQETLPDTPERQEHVSAPRQDAGPRAAFERRVNSAVDRRQTSEGTHVHESDTPLSQIRALCKPLSQWMDVAQHAYILEQLKHRCCICSQWVANISIKLHVLKVHPEMYNTAGATALADCKQVGHLISPCRFCGAQVSKTSQHAGTYPVLWQIGLGALLANPATPHGGDRHGPGGSHSVRVPPSPQKAGPCRGAAHHGGETSEVASITSGQKKRPRPRENETSAPPAKSRIERWLRVGSNSQGVGQANASPGRLYSASSKGPYCADDLQRRREPGAHHTGPRGGGRKMEPPAPQRAGQDQSNATTTTYTSDLSHRYAPEAAGRQRKPSECGQARVACVTIGPASGDSRRCSVGVHEVEGKQAPGGPRAGCRGQGAIHPRLEGDSNPAGGTRADPAFFSDPPAHRGDVGTLSDAATRTRLRPAHIERSPLMKEVQDLAFGQDQ